MKTYYTFVLIASLLSLEFMIASKLNSTQAVQSSNLSSNPVSDAFSNPYQVTRSGIPGRREGGGTR